MCVLKIYLQGRKCLFLEPGIEIMSLTVTASWSSGAGWEEVRLEVVNSGRAQVIMSPGARKSQAVLESGGVLVGSDHDSAFRWTRNPLESCLPPIAASIWPRYAIPQLPNIHSAETPSGSAI